MSKTEETIRKTTCHSCGQDVEFIEWQIRYPFGDMKMANPFVPCTICDTQIFLKPGE